MAAVAIDRRAIHEVDRAGAAAISIGPEHQRGILPAAAGDTGSGIQGDIAGAGTAQNDAGKAIDDIARQVRVADLQCAAASANTQRGATCLRLDGQGTSAAESWVG